MKTINDVEHVFYVSTGKYGVVFKATEVDRVLGFETGKVIFVEADTEEEAIDKALKLVNKKKGKVKKAEVVYFDENFIDNFDFDGVVRHVVVVNSEGEEHEFIVEIGAEYSDINDFTEKELQEFKDMGYYVEGDVLVNYVVRVIIDGALDFEEYGADIDVILDKVRERYSDLPRILFSY